MSICRKTWNIPSGRDFPTWVRRGRRAGMANWRTAKLESRLEIEHDPCWRVVARVFLPTGPSVNTAVHESDRQIGREQKVIESHAFVLLPPFKFVIPECPERPVRM
jgi:hypothetical protein